MTYDRRLQIYTPSLPRGNEEPAHFHIQHTSPAPYNPIPEALDIQFDSCHPSRPRTKHERRNMPSINVTLKDGASTDEYDKAKKQVESQGGKITTEYKLIKGFTAEMPADKVTTLQSNEHIEVEADKEVTTQ